MIKMLRGAASSLLDSRGKFKLPQEFNAVLADNAVASDISIRLFLMPLGERVILHTSDSLNELARGWFKHVTFGSRLEVHLQGTQVRACPAVCLTIIAVWHQPARV
jgi:hypothetical protein